MIPGSGPPAGVKVLVATRPVDFRRGMDGLARTVKEELRADPYSGVVYVFRAKRTDRIKLPYWDGSGLVLYAKRLEQGGFRWPQIEGGVMRMTSVQLIATCKLNDVEPLKPLFAAMGCDPRLRGAAAMRPHGEDLGIARSRDHSRSSELGINSLLRP